MLLYKMLLSVLIDVRQWRSRRIWSVGSNFLLWRRV